MISLTNDARKQGREHCNGFSILIACVYHMTDPLFSLVYFSRLKYILLLGLILRWTSRIKIEWSFSKTTDHSHFQFFLDVSYLFLQVNNETAIK